MKRRKHRRSNWSGYVFRRGNFWLVRYRETIVEDGKLVSKQVSKKLAAVEPEHARLKKPPDSVLKQAQEFLIPLRKYSPESAQTLTQFVERIYFPHAEALKTSSTIYNDRNRWKTHLDPRVGNIRLRDFRTITGEHLMLDIARSNDLSKGTLKQCKSLLSAIFKHAKRLGLIDGINPMTDVSIPRSRGKSETYAYPLADIQAMLRVLPEPSRTVVATAGYAGLRRGEIQGLGWPDYCGQQLNVQRSIWEGTADEPKSLQSRAGVPVIAALGKILDHFRLHQGNRTEGPMFRASNGSAIRLNNLLKYQILPVLNRCKTCGKPEYSLHRKHHDKDSDHPYERDASLPIWRGWHALRRGLATNLHALGVDDLTIQRILRHSNVSVTQQSYIKTVPTHAVEAMNRLNAQIEGVIH